MHKAYDTILESEVSADLAARTDCFEQYRYECACCGEEVYISAANSERMVPYFRHRNGNNEVECENYLGGYRGISSDSRSRISNRERVDFYFEKQKKIFSIGLRFSENEINDYQQQGAFINLWLATSDRPIISLPINKKNFTPENSTLIPINKFSLSYCLSNNLNGLKRQYNLFNFGNIPTFFKIQTSDIDFKAKLVRGKMLFTNVPYFVVFHNEYSMPRDVYFLEEIEVTESFQFETMGRRFMGKVLTIKEKTLRVDALLISWSYQLEDAETLTLLWPPASHNGDVSIIHSNYAFFYTSFDLQAHGNINVSFNDIYKVDNSITRVLIKPKTKVFKKNAEMVIDKIEYRLTDFEKLTMSEKIAKALVVPSVGSFFVFNRSGVKLLVAGQTISLTRNSEIRQYKYGYPVTRIRPFQKEALSGELLLHDILAHYKHFEALDKDSFLSCKLSTLASHYIAKCKASGLINSVAKQFIEEGKL